MNASGAAVMPASLAALVPRLATDRWRAIELAFWLGRVPVDVVMFARGGMLGAFDVLAHRFRSARP